MTVLSAREIVGYWLQAGGRADRAIWALAESYAESGGDTTAISQAGDYGLWQINDSNFFGLGLTTMTALQPGPNARAAVSMSNAGMDWGPWCTAWVDPSNCGRRGLGLPQPGSPAANQYARASAALGGVVGAAPAGNADPSVINAVQADWAHLQNLVGGTARTSAGRLSSATTLIRRLRS